MKVSSTLMQDLGQAAHFIDDHSTLHEERTGCSSWWFGRPRHPDEADRFLFLWKKGADHSSESRVAPVARSWSFHPGGERAKSREGRSEEEADRFAFFDAARRFSWRITGRRKASGHCMTRHSAQIPQEKGICAEFGQICDGLHAG